MKKWLPIAIAGMALLSACTSAPEQPTGKVDDTFRNQSIKGYIIPDLVPYYSNLEWNQFSSSISSKLRPIFERFPQELQDKKYNNIKEDLIIRANNDFASLLISLEDNIIPPLDAYIAADCLLQDLQSMNLEGTYSELVNLLKEIRTKAAPLAKDSQRIEDCFEFYAKHMRMELTFISFDLKDLNIDPTPNLILLNKSILQCSSSLGKGVSEARTIMTDAQVCKDALLKTIAEGKHREFRLIMLRHDIERVMELAETLIKDIPDTSKQSPASASQQNSNPNKANKDSKVSSESKSPIVSQEISTPSGLKYTITKAGNGQTCKVGDLVRIHYTGTFKDGTVFDSSYERKSPLEVPLGKGFVIDGWENGIPGMRVGEKRHLVIPPALAYGKEGSGPIPPDTTLIFDVELVSID